MTSAAGPDRRSLSDVARDRAVLRDAAPAVAALVLVQASLIALDPDGGQSIGRAVWSLLPLLPFGWLVWTQVRALRRADERQRVLQLSALAIGFGAAMALALLGGLLEGADLGDPARSLQVTFIGATLAWVGSLGYLTRPAR